MVRVISLVFSRIVDLENFGNFLRKESTSVFMRQELMHRLGILNIFCALSPDGSFDLDLAAWDHREAAKILIRLAAVEPGPNLSEVSYVKSMLQPCKPTWVLPPNWGDDTPGPPQLGMLAFKYDSDPSLGCSPVWKARLELTAFRSLAGTRGTFIRGVDPVVTKPSKGSSSHIAAQGIAERETFDLFSDTRDYIVSEEAATRQDVGGRSHEELSDQIENNKDEKKAVYSVKKLVGSSDGPL